MLQKFVHTLFAAPDAKGKAGWCGPARFARALAMLVLAAGLYGTPAFPVDKKASGGAAAEPQSESLWNRGTLTGSWAGVRPQLETAGIKLSVQEQSEVWANLTGGGRTGPAYAGLTTAALTVDLARTLG